jgi:hypothetical protein
MIFIVGAVSSARQASVRRPEEDVGFRISDFG